MIAGSIVLAVTLLAFAAWLHWNESVDHGVREEQIRLGRGHFTKLDIDYFARRSRARSWIHLLIAGCGFLIMVTVIVSSAIVWMVGWIAVMMSLMLVMFLAGLDGLRTYAYHQRKLPEVRRQILGED